MKSDLQIGYKINNWTIIEGPFKIKGKDHFKIRCQCGHEQINELRYILSNRFSKSCRSCSQKARRQNDGVKFSVGSKFQNLTILSEPKRYKGNSYYKVKCDCGHIYYTGHPTLVRKSKGTTLPYCNACFSSDKKKPKRNTMVSDNISKSLYGKLVYNAKIRGIDFKLSPEYLEDLWVKQNGKCALSNLDITLDVRSIDVKYTKGTASLDRIDSTIGYIEGNVQWVHKYINYMKCDFTQNEFIDFCIAVANFHANLQPSQGLTALKGSETSD